jgi:hypothetical protein
MKSLGFPRSSDEKQEAQKKLGITHYQGIMFIWWDFSSIPFLNA